MSKSYLSRLEDKIEDAEKSGILNNDNNDMRDIQKAKNICSSVGCYRDFAGITLEEKNVVHKAEKAVERMWAEYREERNC